MHVVGDPMQLSLLARLAGIKLHVLQRLVMRMRRRALPTMLSLSGD